MPGVGETTGSEGPEALPYRQVVGPLPTEEHDMAGWKAAWEREQGRGWTTSTRAHATMAAIDGAGQGNSFRKQMLALRDAMAPAADDRSEAITVVRHEGEVGYTKEASRILEGVVVSMMPPSPLAEYVVLAPPYISHGGFRPPHQLLTACRFFRVKAGFFVGWHEVEFPSCPVPIRTAHYPRVTPWWPSVEVPYGAMVEMPPVLTYLKGALLANHAWAWNVFRSEWAVLSGAYLVEEYRMAGRLWLFPRALRQWIVRVGLEKVCTTARGVDPVAVGELGALLALLDQLPGSKAFETHLKAMDPHRRDRSSWVRVRVEREEMSSTAYVDEDLAPFPLRYSRDVVEARELVGGTDLAHLLAPPAPSSTAAFGHPSRSTPSGPPMASRLLVSSPLGHRDVPDELLAVLDGLIPDRVAYGLTPLLGASGVVPDPLRVGPLVAGLLHVLADVGAEVGKWAARQEALPTDALQELLDVVGQPSLREALRREVGLAEAMAQRVYARQSASAARVRPRDDDEEEGPPGRNVRPWGRR